MRCRAGQRRCRSWLKPAMAVPMPMPMPMPMRCRRAAAVLAGQLQVSVPRRAVLAVPVVALLAGLEGCGICGGGPRALWPLVAEAWLNPCAGGRGRRRAPWAWPCPLSCCPCLAAPWPGHRRQRVALLAGGLGKGGSVSRPPCLGAAAVPCWPAWGRCHAQVPTEFVVSRWAMLSRHEPRRAFSSPCLHRYPQPAPRRAHVVRPAAGQGPGGCGFQFPRWKQVRYPSG